MAMIDSDNEGSIAGSVADSHASDMPDTPNSKKKEHDQNKFKAKHGSIMESSPSTRLCCTHCHTASENNEDDPFLSLKSLFLALWTSIYLRSEPKINKLILHLAFFCNLASLMAFSCDEKDSSKVQFQIRAFLRCNFTSVTALARLLLCRLIYFPPLTPQNGCLSSCGAIFFPVHGTDAKAACRDTRCIKSACRPNQTTIGCRCSKSTPELGENGKAIQKGKGGAIKQVCCYEF